MDRVTQDELVRRFQLRIHRNIHLAPTQALHHHGHQVELLDRVAGFHGERVHEVLFIGFAEHATDVKEELETELGR